MVDDLKIYETILVDNAEGVFTITLNRPDRLNAFIQALHNDLKDALNVVRTRREAGLARALVITGAGRGFCAGQDLGERSPNPDGSPPDLGASIEENYKPLILAIKSLEMPVIAAVNGVAAGSGVSLALACDLVFAAESAAFVLAFSKLGLVPDCGASWHLPRLVGEARAKGIALLGDKLSAAQAVEYGLIWRSVADDQLQSVVHKTAVQLAAGPTLGYTRTKQTFEHSQNNDLETQLNLERDYMRELGRTHDYAEGVKAFKEKRKADFKGH